MIRADDLSGPIQIFSKGLLAAQGQPSLRNIPSAVLRYGLTVVSIALALLVALFLQHYNFHRTELALFLFAIAVTVWYSGGD
jgi:hypothetical protein